MLYRNKKKIIIIVTIIAIALVAISAVVITFLYLKTDILKSEKQLFGEYIAKNFENMETITDFIMNNEYNQNLQNKKYTNKSEIKVNYITDIGTSAENSNNDINKLKISIEGTNNPENQKKYQDIKLLKNEDKLLELELLKQANIYGIKFSDYFKQYILTENQNLREILQKAGYNEENLSKIPEQLEFKDEIRKIKFSDEEKEKLKDKYLKILDENISKDKFSKQTNQKLTINKNEITANSYTLSLSKEELNNLYIKILENIKQDEIILSKIEIIDQVLENVQEKQLKQQFIEKIEKTIENITKNNIGNETNRIIVYENNKNTIATRIQTSEYEINVNFLKNGEETYAKITYENMTADPEEQKSNSLELKINSTNMSIISVKKDKTGEKKLTIDNTIKIKNESKYENTILARYEYENEKIELNIQSNIEIVNNFEDEITLNDKNSLNIDELSDKNLQKVYNSVSKKMKSNIEKINNNIKVEDLKIVLNKIGISNSQNMIDEDVKVSQTERNRFNSQFEILQGQKLNTEKIINLIDTIKNNLINIEVVSGNEVKIELSRNSNNEKMTKKLTDFIENNRAKNYTYDVKIDYDEKTKLAKYIILTINVSK